MPKRRPSRVKPADNHRLRLKLANVDANVDKAITPVAREQMAHRRQRILVHLNLARAA